MKAFAIAVSVLVLKALVAGAVETPVWLADSGWWDDSGTHDASNEVILAGDYRGREYRGFYVFNLFNIVQRVTTATLRFYLDHGVTSPDPTETYTLFDVSTPIGVLTASGTGATEIFADLGSGTVYGAGTFSSADNFMVVDIALNDAAITALNQSLVRKFAMGGAVTTLDHASQGLEEDISGPGGYGNLTELVLSVLTTCGNGVTDPGEECDDGNTNPSDGCTNFCTVCGNDLVIAPETCDDGNLIDGDGCNADCGVAPLPPSPTPTLTPTSAPTPTPTSCYGSLPVVKPVPARTDQQQLVVYFCGRIAGASSMSACSEAGCATDVSFGSGDPNCTVSCLATCNKGTVPLRAGQTNHIRVCQENGFCSAHGCVTNDLNGAPLVVQVAPLSPTPTATLTASATPTITPTPTATNTSTATATPSPSITATATIRPSENGGGGCAITPSRNSGAAWWLLLPGLGLLGAWVKSLAKNGWPVCCAGGIGAHPPRYRRPESLTSNRGALVRVRGSNPRASFSFSRTEQDSPSLSPPVS